jgi:hypothetical protein
MPIILEFIERAEKTRVCFSPCAPFWNVAKIHAAIRQGLFAKILS